MISDFVTAYAQQQYLLAEEGIEQARIDQANMWYIDASLVEEYPKNWSSNRIDTLLKNIDNYKIKPLLHGNFKLPLASDVSEVRQAAIEIACQEVELASRLDAPLIIHGGAIVEPRMVRAAKRKALDDYLRSLDVIINKAAKKGVLILLENLSNYMNYRPFHYIFTTPDEFRYTLERVKCENVKLFYDIGHGFICNGDPIAVIDEFHSQIWGFSVSNNDGIADQHLGINNGLIDYQAVVNKVVEKRWKGVIAFEVRGKPFAKNIADLQSLFTHATIATESHKIAV